MVLNVCDPLGSYYVGPNIYYNYKQIELYQSNNLIYYQFSN